MFNRYPYTNFHELNLDYFIQHFNEIFTEWEQLYNELQSWKTDTTEELDQWRADVEEDLDEREAALRAELEIWKQDTADDISEWETATLNALDAWKTAATTQFEAIRVQAAASAEAAAASQTAAASAAASALQSATEAEEAAAAIQASAAQIQQNSDDIDDLKMQVDNLNDIIFPNSDVIVTSQDDYALDATFKNFPFGVALTPNNAYRIFIKFDVFPQALVNIQTATGTTGDTIVDTITDDFVGDSWTEGKTCIYTPTAPGIINLRIQFNSAYDGSYSADIYVYDYTKEQTTAIEELDNKIDETDEEVDSLRANLTVVNNEIFPNSDTIVAYQENYALDAVFKNFPFGVALTPNNAYRIFIKFDVFPQALVSIQTATGNSGSSVVDTITDNFVGNSWTDGKTCIYTPTVSGIINLRIQFNSAYDGSYSADIYVYDYTKEQLTAIDELDNKIDEIEDSLSAEMENLAPVVNLDKPYNLLMPNVEYINHTRIDYTTGWDVYSENFNEAASDYIEIDASQGYLCNYVRILNRYYDEENDTYNTSVIQPFTRMYMAFYDENKVFVASTSTNTDISKAIPANAKYVRVCLSDIAYKPWARLIYGNFAEQPTLRILTGFKIPPHSFIEPNSGYENFKMVMFGDSITHGDTGINADGVSYIDYANDELHSNIINVGFGGTRMTYTLANQGLFCFYHLCECIVSNDPDAWDDLDDYAENTNTSYLPHLTTLKAIDWNTVNAIGILYGANDFTSNTPVGTEFNTDTSKYDGACAYGIELLLEKYPHLQVVILTPFYRQLTFGDPSTGSDTRPNTLGLFMKDYAESLYNVQNGLHVPIANTHSELGINQYTIKYWTMDGTHPRTNQGQARFGHLFANIVRRYLSPV